MTIQKPALADSEFVQHLLDTVQGYDEESAAIERLAANPDRDVQLALKRLNRVEDDLRTVSSNEVTRLARALANLTLRPCHVTGMHDPNHTDRYLCREQQADLLDRLLRAAGIELADIPHELHPEGTCYWCHEVPTQEEYRVKLRKVWDWAGVPHTAELAALAPDWVRPGDDEEVLAALTDEFETWQVVLPRVSFTSSDRYFRVLSDLDDAGRIDRQGISARRKQVEA